MTRAELLKEISKLENSLLKSYKGLRTEKYKQSNRAFELMQRIFKEVESTGQYKTIAKSKLNKAQLFNYYEQLKDIREMNTSTVKGWREQVKSFRAQGQQNGIDTYAIEKKYKSWIDFIDSKPWQESAPFYYDSNELNRISWLEPAEKTSELQKWLLEVENHPFTRAQLLDGKYVLLSTIHNAGNTEEILNEIWHSRIGF